MKKILDIKKLATEIVGDGKRPNKYFVTIAYGWYKPNGEDEEMKQAENSLDNVTVFFTDKEQANDFYDNVRLAKTNNVTGETISQIILEDRLTGVVKDKYLEQVNDNYFIPIEY